MDQSPNAIAEHLAHDLAADTIGIALTGSIATGTDHPDSDIDLIAIAQAGRDDQTQSLAGRLVTITWTTLEDANGAFDQPWSAGQAVPGWRDARILHDPTGALAALKDRARNWQWDDIAAAADRWAGATLVGLAEEVHKVHGMLATGAPRAAAANRDLIALQLPGALAAADRILYGSENRLWDLVCQAEGEAWARAWDTATGIKTASFEDSCRAALTLYRLAADRLKGHLEASERPIVEVACNLTGRPQS
ncbi:nucleotidyltransferase domain-containing protein [Glycomyces buryatensis]|uniref:Polymerase nucleotidyl transferase domain-containing protein n=1 Tax=Glycomyces buryatensis TaxID=2570927 RepID=A0A4S8PQK6_9ACTN|nr:nucleotidyltransferase domain-containing protein [Glycomyces buryatensis]THV33430.1 hypothetical protein FAB82_25115 [Glycomyces buryatensis]